ncbi:MAG: HlyC/CorC family transporter [Bacillales bacterium]|nr:HlyC/CorC family transporter [Bacillales bacterium]
MIIILVLIFMNGILSMMETAIVALRKSELEEKAKSGMKKAKRAYLIAKEPNQLLSSIHINLTLIGMIVGAISSVSIAEEISRWLFAAFPSMPSVDLISYVLVIAFISFLIIIFGEMVPKRVALNRPEKTAMTLANGMYWLTLVATPIVRFFTSLSRAVLKMFHIQLTPTRSVTEEEIRQMIEQGVSSGIVEEVEHEIVEQVFNLGDLRLNDIFTPRTQLTWIDLDDPLETNLRKIIEGGHSFYPAGKGDLDNFAGMIHTKDLLTQSLNHEPIDLHIILRPALFLPEPMKVYHALETMKKEGRNEAIVIDEYGGIEGLVTLHDIMEELIGEIPGEDDPDEPKITERDDHTWLADGLVSIEDFKRYFDIEELPDIESKISYHTLGGFMILYLGKIPAVKDKIDIEHLTLEVIDMDDVRVDKILITKKTEESDQQMEEFS